jgi:hypothetical protein
MLRRFKEPEKNFEYDDYDNGQDNTLKHMFEDITFEASTITRAVVALFHDTFVSF